SKIMVADESILRLGSSNLSNRSMGLDTECDVALVAAPGTEHSKRIGRIRDSLLAEQLGVPIDDVEVAIRARGSLFEAMDELRAREGRSRDLLPFQSRVPGWLNAIMPD